MSSLSCNIVGCITIFLCILSILIQVSDATFDSDEDDEIFQNKNTKLHKRKSARMAFLEESDDPLFKFLTKMLNTAQLRTKNRLARAQNGVKKTHELKTEVANKLKINDFDIEIYE